MVSIEVLLGQIAKDLLKQVHLQAVFERRKAALHMFGERVPGVGGVQGERAKDIRPLDDRG